MLDSKTMLQKALPIYFKIKKKNYVHAWNTAWDTGTKYIFTK